MNYSQFISSKLKSSIFLCNEVFVNERIRLVHVKSIVYGSTYKITKTTQHISGYITNIHKTFSNLVSRVKTLKPNLKPVYRLLKQEV